MDCDCFKDKDINYFRQIDLFLMDNEKYRINQISSVLRLNGHTKF